MVVGHLGTFGAPLNVRHFFSKFDSEYFSLIIFLKYLFILLLIMISFIIMTLLEKNKICRTFRAVGHLGTLHTSSSIPVQDVIDFPIVSSSYQHSFESPKSVKVRHEYIVIENLVEHGSATLHQIFNDFIN